MALAALSTDATRLQAGATAACAHCGAPVAGQVDEGRPSFCCSGCAGAYSMIKGLGLERYYSLRDAAAPTPADADAADWREFVQSGKDETCQVEFLVEGMHCAACLWLIEQALRAQPGVQQARLSATTRRLTLNWRGATDRVNELAGIVTRLGYRCLALTSEAAEKIGSAEERDLLRAMAVAGFAAANIMLLSVSVWSGHVGEMGMATRDLFHGISALIAIPAIAYAGRPFYRSAYAVLRQGRTNMDVPITIGVTLAVVVSLAEMLRSGPHAYFDAAVTLLFFLLVGRYLDLRARGFARRTAQRLVAWTAKPVSVVGESGILQRPAHMVAVGDRVLVATGERVPVDGMVIEGRSALDSSLINGETLPQAAEIGTHVFAGAINLEAPLTLRVTAVGSATLLGEIARLMEAAEHGRDQYVRLAERVARWYAPVVHVTAVLSFAGWMLIGDADWRSAMLIAAAVLIITCPCALALAVPVVQVVASSRLMRRGILLKSATALERAAPIDTIVFDKTGTLTLGQPRLLNEDAGDAESLHLAASLAVRSRHPLCKALLAACGDVAQADGVQELPGQGLRLQTAAGDIRLGHARFAGVDVRPADGYSELWLTRPGHVARRFRFTDTLRSDAATVVDGLRRAGFRVAILSGDHPAAVSAVAEQIGIADWQAGMDPRDKAAAIAALKQQGRHVLMVGDGLNDAVALAQADASLSPSSGLDIAQNAADAVFQGEKLVAVPEFLSVARRSRSLAFQNLVLALVYNLFAVPLAIAGMVTPLIAAIAMSSSSILVVGNALRLDLGRRREAA
ncbi:MAG: heavy metal translocating P-type ATPase [Ferrovibrio sp.]|uniref:heavy metal translocating P-type ATPase n=1 Tax=Ferrovibrio sp. TaxID=1917215 RepID=UPI00391BE4C4